MGFLEMFKNEFYLQNRKRTFFENYYVVESAPSHRPANRILEEGHHEAMVRTQKEEGVSVIVDYIPGETHKLFMMMCTGVAIPHRQKTGILISADELLSFDLDELRKVSDIVRMGRGAGWCLCVFRATSEFLDGVFKPTAWNDHTRTLDVLVHSLWPWRHRSIM